ncbi:MAG TPA: Gfo/Idh/MocA family oxidoreductase [Gemmata sp.]|jgi:predicted dehydrogenase|nr:Gfo/Idh/MocA family oxidoreductase [Gemmata sp.]
MRVILAAVAGTGFIGPVHVEAVRRLGHRVVGILGSTAEKSQAAANALGIGKGYASFAELLSDPEVEVVHIATPNRFHGEQCKAALAAGKHVICEKPLAMNSVETAELVRLAKTHRELMTAVNYNVRFYPLCLEARERLRSGQLGEVYHVAGSYLQDWLLYPTDFNWRILARDGGDLRAVADIGTHWLDLVTFITGLEIAEVCADLRTVHPERQKPLGGTETFSGSASGSRETVVPVTVTTEDYGSVLLRFTGGARGCFTVSQVTAGRKNSIRYDIACGKSALAWDSEEPETLRIGHRDRANELLACDPAILSTGVRRYADYPGGHVEGFPDTFKQLYKAVYDAIATGIPNPLIPTFADGHREALICEAILKSHRSGKWEQVGY